MKRLRNTMTRASLALLLAMMLLVSFTLPTFAADEAPIFEQPVLSAETAVAFLDEFFGSEIVQPHYVGAAITIVHGDEVVAQQGYGYANVEAQEVVSPEDTLFRVASVSKSLTAVAIMQLAEQGLIDLDEDILTYLPGVELINPYDTPVTVGHLLTHESGLEVRDPQAEDLHMEYDFHISIDDYIAQHMPPVVRNPGTAYMYDNFAYLLLGKIVENVSEQDFENYMQEHIFAPLNMVNSSFDITQSRLEQLAVGYDAASQTIDPYIFRPNVMPHGGMLSTAEDMAQFMLAYLNDGGDVLSPESIAEMSQYRSSIHALIPNTTYGFEAASQIALAGSHEEIIVKFGDLPGNSSMLLFIPEQNTGVFLTYNVAGALRDLFYEQFITTFFPEYAAPAEFGEIELASVEQLKQLEGYYTDLRLRVMLSKIEAVEDGTLIISDAFFGPRSLTQVDDGLFIDELAYRYTAFTMDEQDGSVYMSEPYLNPLGYAVKGQTPVGYVDVDEEHEYAAYIHALQSVGVYSNESEEAFQPDASVTRAELVYYLLDISMIDGVATDSYNFADIEGHLYADYIQFAHEMEMIQGDGQGNFHPDRAVTRQEAAMMIWNIYKQIFPAEWFDVVALEGDTSDWAVPAVQMNVALGLYGPEVTWSEEGAANFASKQLMTKAEKAAYLYQLLTQPIEQIAMQYMPQVETE